MFSDKMLNINLESLYAELKITSSPEDATVVINKKQVGKTPSNWSLKKGKYEIRLTKQNYTDQVKNIDLLKDENINLKLNMSPEYLAKLKREGEKAKSRPEKQPKIDGKSSNFWLWATVGAVVASGVAAYFILNGEEESEGIPDLPGPPARP